MAVLFRITRRLSMNSLSNDTLAKERITVWELGEDPTFLRAQITVIYRTEANKNHGLFLTARELSVQSGALPVGSYWN